MRRREIITAGAGILSAGILSASVAQAAKTEGAAGPYDSNSLIEAASSCVKVGEVCRQHCVDLLSSGDKSLAQCLKTVNEMLTMCKALLELSAQRSSHLAKFAVICEDVCKNCEKACRVHESSHAPCKNCAESCARCGSECAKVAA